MLKDKTLEEFAAVLAAKEPVPGGGGASAYVGALGAALSSMVGVYTVGKEKYAAVEKDVLALIKRAETLRAKFLALVDADAEAFAPLGAAYAIPKDAPGRTETLEKCLRDACAVPLEITRLAAEAIEICRELAEKGSVLMISDAATGAVFCRAALKGGAVNVRVNTRLMTDREYAERIDAEVASLTDKYAPMADEVYEKVFRKLSEKR